MKSIHWRILTCIQIYIQIYIYIYKYIYIYIYTFFSDIDECAKGTRTCSANAVCTNTEGSYKCTCKTGYFENGNVCTKRIFFFLCFHGISCDDYFFLMLNALHLYSLRGLAFDSNMQYHPFTVCRFRRSNFVLICNSLCSFDQFACIVGFWRKLDNYDTHMNTKLQTRLQGR